MRPNLSRDLTAAVVLFASISACGKSSPTAPPPAPCTYTLSTSQLSFPASGGSNSVSVTTASQCTWTATSDRGWMSITSGSSGSGGGVVNISVTPNTTTAERSGTLTIAGLTVAVREDGVVPPALPGFADQRGARDRRQRPVRLIARRKHPGARREERQASVAFPDRRQPSGIADQLRD